MVVGLSGISGYALLLVTLGLSACANVTPDGGSARGPTEQRLDELERRVESLESRPEVHAPLRTREDVLKHRDSLVAERGKLLTRYTEQHPAIRDIDRQLRILDLQLKSLEP